MSYPCCRITPHPCRRRILVVYRRIINVFVSSSSSSSSSLLSSSSLYPRHRRRCCRIHVVCTAVVNWPIWPCLSFSLVMFVRCHDLITKSHQFLSDMLCHPALLCARATTACIPFYRSSSLLLSFVPTVTSSSYSWLLCHSCRVCVIHVSHPPEDDSLPPTNNIYADRRR